MYHAPLVFHVYMDTVMKERKWGWEERSEISGGGNRRVKNVVHLVFVKKDAEACA